MALIPIGSRRVAFAFIAGGALTTFFAAIYLLSDLSILTSHLPAAFGLEQSLNPSSVASDWPWEGSNFAAIESRRPLHVAVEEAAGHHEEVFGALLYTLGRLPQTTVSFYRSAPLRFSFDETLSGFFPSPPLSLEKLYTDLAVSQSSFDNVNVDPIDVLISTTCTDVTLPRTNDQLLKAWDARPEGDKFRLVCLVHHADSLLSKDTELAMRPWAIRGALTFMTLSPHVAQSVKRNLGWEMARPDSALRTVPYDACPVYTYIPLFPFDLGLPSAQSSSQRHTGRISNVAIQGNLQQGRRDYTGIFVELEQLIRENPRAWGYLPGSSPSQLLEPDPSIPDRFVLHLIGQGTLDVPTALQHAVAVHAGLSYPAFYSLLSEMDMLVPDFGHKAYYTDMASSSIPAALIGHIPILATSLHVESYSYLDARTMVLRPLTLTHLEAIASLRAYGRTINATLTSHPPGILAAYESLRISGSTDSAGVDIWSGPRTDMQLAAYRADVYRWNDAEMVKALRGLGERSVWAIHPKFS